MIRINFIDDTTTAPVKLWAYRSIVQTQDDIVHGLTFVDKEEAFVGVLYHNSKLQIVKYKSLDTSELFRY